MLHLVKNTKFTSFRLRKFRNQYHSLASQCLVANLTGFLGDFVMQCTFEELFTRAYQDLMIFIRYGDLGTSRTGNFLFFPLNYQASVAQPHPTFPSWVIGCSRRTLGDWIKSAWPCSNIVKVLHKLNSEWRNPLTCLALCQLFSMTRPLAKLNHSERIYMYLLAPNITERNAYSTMRTYCDFVINIL